MKKFIKPFIKYPILGNSIVIALFLFGYLGFITMKTTFFPPQRSKYIKVTASYPGASPEEIEEGIVTKIEDNIKGLEGVERTTSISQENFCSITISTRARSDIDDVLMDVKNAVNSVPTFPTGMENMRIYRQKPRTFAIDFVITGDVSLKKLKYEARKIERELRAKNGISQISLSGFPAEEIEIGVDEAAMRKYGLTFQEISQQVQAGNIKRTGGKIRGDNEEFLIRADVKSYYADKLKNKVLRATSDGAVIKLKDVATVKDKWEESPNKIYYNGVKAVKVNIQNTNEEDLFKVVDITKKYLKNYNAENPKIQAKIIRDGSEIIQERVDLLSNNGLLGIVLVLLFLSLALNPRMSFWVALGIPISFAGMLTIGTFYGLTINVMSLMAMILVLGILVDDGIVIAENIYQHHERGEKPIKAAINGTVEVLPSVIASILTTVVIFGAFFFMEGGLGEHIRDMGFVVIATLLVSLIEATFILPAHIGHSKALRKTKNKQNIISKYAEKILFRLRDKVHAPILKFFLKNPAIAVAIPVALLLITLGAYKGNIIQNTFFPHIEGNNIRVEIEMPAGTPAHKTDSIIQNIEKNVWQVNQEYKTKYPNEEDLITAAVRYIGPNTHQASLSVTMIGSEQRKWGSMEIANKIRKKTDEIKNIEKLNFSTGRHFGKPVVVALRSTNTEQLNQAKEDLKNEMRRISKLKNVMDNTPPGPREIHLELTDKALSLGLNYNNVINQVRNGFFGGRAQRILRGIDEVKIWVRYEQSERRSINQLENMRIKTQNGSSYPLKTIADLSIERGIMTINHINGQRVINVEADVTNPSVSVTNQLKYVEKNILPGIIEKYPEVQYSFEGQKYESDKTTNAVARILPTFLILMFLIMTVALRSIGQSAIIFLLIPFSLIGMAWGHFFQGYIISMMSMFGIIALIGIVVNDSLVLVNTLNRNLRKGMKFMEALIDAGLSRFRPVLLTTLTTVAGLGPLMFSQSRQAQFLAPLAISVAYGLIFGTVLTLFLLPTLLLIFNKMKVFLYNVFSKEHYSAEDVESSVKEIEFVKLYSSETK